MRLKKLFETIVAEELTGDAEVSRMTIDPADAAPGTLFLAIKAFGRDGHRFVDEAIARGAGAVVAEVARPPAVTVPWARVKSSEAVAGPLASAILGHPSRSLEVLAVTGTNGKGTVCSLLYDILLAAGKMPGIIGTIETKFGATVRPTGYTTPPPWVLQQTLHDMADAGCTHVAMEASSHGLSPRPSGRRLEGTRVAVGGFTNLTRDHLDFHGDMSEYERTKGLLFSHYAEKACFHVGCDAGRRLADAFRGERLTVAIDDHSADLVATGVTTTLHGVTATLRRAEGRALSIKLRLIGRHNLENALVAIGMARLAGVALEDAVAALAHSAAPAGRLERVADRTPAVYVDYAHTPDALENVLRCIRSLTRGRVVCVFGAGGDRDRGKRPLMAQVASSLSDLSIVTSENPRSEDPVRIIDDIVAGFPAGAAFVAEPDRFAAIRRAIESAGPDDVVIIAGQGHETTQNFGGRLIEFSDRDVARRILAQLDDAQSHC